MPVINTQGDPDETTRASNLTSDAVVRVINDPNAKPNTMAVPMLDLPMSGIGASGSGKWVVAAGSAGGTAAAVDQKLALVPFRAVPGRALNAIGVNITALGAGSLVRLGIFADDGFGYPDLAATPQDFGTIDSSTTGAKTIAINYAIQAPVIWLAACSQGGTPPSWASLSGGLGWQWADTSNASFTAFVAGYQKTGVAGAFGPLGAVSAHSPAGSPALFVRYA